MSSSGISFGGLASGLDTKAIIAALMAVERRPLAALETKKKGFQSQSKLFGDFETLLDKLRKSLDGVRKTDSFLDYKAELDDDKLLGAKAGAGAKPGTYEIVVRALARAQVSTTAGVADKDITRYGSGSGALNVLKITIDGVTTDIEIDDSNNTLEGIAGAINAAGLDVQATVLDTGRGATPYKLVLSSKRTGADGAFTVGYDDAGSQDFKDLIDGITNTSDASDAHITIDGVDVYRRTNVIGDAIAGVTLDLKGVHVAPANTRLTVSTDTTVTGDKIQKFVEAYNAVVDFVAAQNKVDENGQTSSALFGDSTLRSIRNSLRDIAGGTAATGNDAFSLLAQVGVTTDRDGKLTFERSEFDEALTSDDAAVRKLFVDETAGFAARLHGLVDGYLDSVDGLLKSRKDGFAQRVKDIERQIERGEARLERYEQTLVTRFSNLETLLNRLQNQGGALGSLSTLTSRTQR
jgi:flagellar hook-associated protein 2